ncbi:MAG: cell division protein FtsK [Chloroflexi bacterium]|nr:cell division protein FtsK [Chloroflexota bacterium]
MDAEALQIGALILAMALVALMFRQRFGRDWREFRLWQAQQRAIQPEPTSISPFKPLATSLDPRTLPEAGTALLNPPHDLRVLAHELRQTNKRFVLALGWRSVQGVVSLVHGSLIDDFTHVQVSGATGSGKDGWVRTALLYLCLTNPAERLQLALVDGKAGLSWLGWREKAHVGLFAEAEHELAPALTWLTEQRLQRQKLLKAAECERWEEYQGHDLPLLVVFISELTLLEQAIGAKQLEQWLNSELTSGRAAGIRYIIATQTFSNLSTRFRSQISLAVAGYQPRDDADEPNTTLPTKAFPSSALPPSRLPSPPAGAGVFSCVQGRNAVTVRTSFIDKTQRQQLLSLLPDRQQALPTLEAAPTKAASLPIATDQPLIALAQTPSQSYNRYDLAQLLLQYLNRPEQLLDAELFRNACGIEYKRLRSYAGVARLFWGKDAAPNKSRLIKQALERQATPNEQEMLANLLGTVA